MEMNQIYPNTVRIMSRELKLKIFYLKTSVQARIFRLKEELQPEGTEKNEF